jgi:HAMP domain-containing protein
VEESGLSETSPRSTSKRGRYLIEARTQLAVALPLMAIPLVVALAYALAVYVLPGEAALSALTPEEARNISFRASVVYLGFAAVAMAAAAVFLTHRFVGPAWVIERAIRGMSAGEYDQRVSLRPRDHLQSLASAVTELRDELRAQDGRRRQLAREAVSLLDEDDRKGARDLLLQLAQLEKQPASRDGNIDA